MSWQASKDGKIYWCAQLPGHVLAVKGGELLIDDTPASQLLAALTEDTKKKK